MYFNSQAFGILRQGKLKVMNVDVRNLLRKKSLKISHLIKSRVKNEFPQDSNLKLKKARCVFSPVSCLK